MDIVMMSDLHGAHNSIAVPEGDLLLITGDISGRGTEYEVKVFMDWLEVVARGFEATVLIAGNHDFLAEDSPQRFKSLVPANVIYLNDELYVHKGIKIWGSPVTPRFFDWAFNRDPGPDIRKHWDMIPTDVDILLTHGPLEGVLDRTERGVNAGCKDLLEKIETGVINPKLHVFGHIHEGYGMKEINDTVFVNASIMNLRYNPVNKPVVLDYLKAWKDI